MTAPGATTAALPVAIKACRILIVDDEEMVAMSLRRLMRPHDTSACSSGKEAVELFCAEPCPFDLMFCDLSMPGFGGIEVYNAIRSRRPGLEARIVFMTGGAFTSQIEDFLDSGSYRCLDKPFNRKQVLDLIEAVSRG